MTLTFGDVRDWTSAPLGKAGDGIKDDLTELERSREVLEDSAVPASWQGFTRIAAEAARDRRLAELDRHMEGKRSVRLALYDAEEQVTTIERLVKDVEETARTQEYGLHDDGRVEDVARPPTFDSRWEAEEYGSSRTNGAVAIAEDIGAILAAAAAADATIARGIPSGHVTEIDEYGQESPEVAERWAELTDAERRAVIEQMIEELARESGVEMPEIIWEDESWGSNGQWSEGDPSELRLNEGLLDDPRILHTVAHEVRHGRQFEAIRDENDSVHWPWDDPFDEHEADGITEDQADEWEDNFDDYKSTGNGDSYEDYFNQPVEADAREAGSGYRENLTAGEIDRLLEEAR